MRITFTYSYYTEASIQNDDCEDHGFYQPEYDSWHSVRKRKSVNKKIQRKRNAFEFTGDLKEAYEYADKLGCYQSSCSRIDENTASFWLSSDTEKTGYDPDEWIEYSIHFSNMTLRELNEVTVMFLHKNINDNELTVRLRALKWLTNQIPIKEITEESYRKIGCKPDLTSDLTIQFWEWLYILYWQIQSTAENRYLWHKMETSNFDFHEKCAENPNLPLYKLEEYLKSPYRSAALKNPVLSMYLFCDPSLAAVHSIDVEALTK